MKVKITDEKSLSLAVENFSFVAPNADVYFAYSADDEHYVQWDEVTPAGETCVVIGLPKNTYFKLIGNSGEAILNY